ncbi:precorrin-8X methylmutase [Candidatus Protofrankia californiensis]|uniref:precorrin-8X methylmutase n=1 Tax=Candidatus Protofrankia californiensis TaxID=1839754 RepID=UPI001F4A054A|nr:precorrin-8X methylmutase [Candidatus Protofrankia californiensis]
MTPGSRVAHPIELRSYEILRARLDGTSLDTARLPPLTRAVVERVVHATADIDYVADLVCDETALGDAVAAIAAHAPVVTDVRMTAAGITTRNVVCRLGDVDPVAAARDGLTRSAAAVGLALDEVGPGAVWVIGCAPTALERLLTLADLARPALVIGLPVGFVGAVEAKEALRAAGLPAVSNRSEKGGAAVAAAAVNALLYEGLNP